MRWDPGDPSDHSTHLTQVKETVKGRGLWWKHLRPQCSSKESSERPLDEIVCQRDTRNGPACVFLQHWLGSSPGERGLRVKAAKDQNTAPGPSVDYALGNH